MDGKLTSGRKFGPMVDVSDSETRKARYMSRNA